MRAITAPPGICTILVKPVILRWLVYCIDGSFTHSFAELFGSSSSPSL